MRWHVISCFFSFSLDSIYMQKHHSGLHLNHILNFNAKTLQVVRSQGFALKDSVQRRDESVQLPREIIWASIMACVYLCVCVYFQCQNNFQNTLFPARLHIRSAFCSLLFLPSQSNPICTKDNWTALLCISLCYRKLGGTSVNSEGYGKSASTIWD